MGATYGGRHRLSGPGASASKRMFVGGKPHFEGEVVIKSAVGRSRTPGSARIAKPDTILVCYRRLIVSKFDGSEHRQYPGRPRSRPELDTLVVRMARENSGWGTTASLSRRPTWKLYVGSDGRQHSSPSPHCSLFEAKPDHFVQGFYRYAHEGTYRRRFL